MNDSYFVKNLMLYTLCAGALIVALDSTVVTVALPTIKNSLSFSSASLDWIINAYTLVFGGFLLLSGRLGDLFGKRRLFIIGIALFTVASLICAISTSKEMLIGARSMQGLGAAITSATSLALISQLYKSSHEHAKAMGVYAFTSVGGATAGLLVGGVILSILGWHWIFLINIPIGITLIIASLRVVPKDKPNDEKRDLDIAGAGLMTAFFSVLTYAVMEGSRFGWTSTKTGSLMTMASLLLVGFVWTERIARKPIVSFSLFKSKNIVIANITSLLWSGAMLSWFFLSTLYLQLVLHYTPLEVGLAFLAQSIPMAITSLGYSALLIARFGIRKPLIIGLMVVGIGLMLFARAPVNGRYVTDVLPGMLFVGAGAGIAMNPLLSAAMKGTSPSEEGLASGVVNTSLMIGGALGLAILTSVAATSTGIVRTHDAIYMLTRGYHAAYIVGAAWAAIGALLMLFTSEANRIEGNC